MLVFTAIASVRYKRDLNVMDDSALEDLLYDKLDWSASTTDGVRLVPPAGRSGSLDYEKVLITQ